jgi:hypothetical protein
LLEVSRARTTGRLRRWQHSDFDGITFTVPMVGDADSQPRKHVFPKPNLACTISALGVNCKAKATPKFRGRSLLIRIGDDR